MEYSLYKVLGVPINATLPEIRKAYHRLAVQMHPDKNKSRHANDKFAELLRAYQTLSDEEKRREYDAELRTFEPFFPSEIYIVPLGSKRSREIYFVRRQPQVNFLKSLFKCIL